MELRNNLGDIIYLDSRFDIDKIKSLIKSNKHSEIDEYLSTIEGYPSHAQGGVDIKIGKDGVRFVRNDSEIKAQEGLLLPSVKDEKKLAVYELYELKTGKDWSTAKKEGLTTGTYEDNMKLRNRLLSGEFDNKKQNANNTTSNEKQNTNNLANNESLDYSAAKTFGEAFRMAREKLGPNQIFIYKGRKFGTNLKGEKFEPSDEVLARVNMNNAEVKERLKLQNKMVGSVYSDKQTVKLEPEYQDWEHVKKRKQEINKMNQVDIIKEYHKDTGEQYLVLDKKRAKMHLYRGDKEIASYNVGIGENIGDEQTRTKIKDGKVMWEEGNKMTGAGIYTVSNVNPRNKQFSNAPTWNFFNEEGIEVPMVIHSSFGNRTSKIMDEDDKNNRLSNGCINGICYDLQDLYRRGFGKNQKLYVLPEEEGNRFEIRNGKLIFVSDNPNVNRTKNTLNYKPIKLEIDEEAFRKDVFKTFDFNDEEEFEKTKAFVKALQDNKQEVMKVAQIDGDTYNDLVKIAFGIYGNETNFGDTHSGVGNVVRAINKKVAELNREQWGLPILPKYASSPDYERKSKGYFGMHEGSDESSQGLTQLRFSQIKKESDIQRQKIQEGKLPENFETLDKKFERFGIKSHKDLMDPAKSAIATVLYLAYLAKNRKGLDIDNLIETLPGHWGGSTKDNKQTYISNVKDKSRYLKIKELN